jgi:hypothetical protein
LTGACLLHIDNAKMMGACLHQVSFSFLPDQLVPCMLTGVLCITGYQEVTWAS